MFRSKTDKPILGREDILKADDIVTEPVEVPEWGGTVLVKGMTGKERDIFDAGWIKDTGDSRKVNITNFRARLCAATVVDEAGKTIFTPKDVSDLAKKSATALQKVFDVAVELCGLSEDDVEELVEVLIENPTEDSPSD